MKGNKLFIGYEFKSILRFIAFFFILFGIVLFFEYHYKSEIIALSFVLIVAGFYFFSVHSFIEIDNDKFRIVTCSFYVLDSGKWYLRNNYPFTSVKSVQKTYELPRIGRLASPSILMRDMDQRAVLTDEFQKRFINLKDFSNGKDVSKFINEINRFLGTEYAKWGSKMKNRKG